MFSRPIYSLLYAHRDLKQKLTDNSEDHKDDEDDDINPPRQISSTCQRQSGAKNLESFGKIKSLLLFM